MDITYLGEYSFKIKTKSGSVLMDPAVGGSADLIIATGGKVNLKGVTGTSRREKPFVIEKPGEYEVEGISVFGYQDTSENTIFVLQAEEMRILNLGSLNTVLSEKMVTDLDGIDLLIVPVKSPELAVKLVEKFDPSYVIPVGDVAEIDKFVSVYGRTPQTVKTLTVSKISLPQDTTEVIRYE